jgi:hypothetical protein
MLNALVDQGLSHRSIRNVRALRAALNQAMRYCRVVRNVATLVDVPGTATFAAEPLNQEQAQQWAYRHIEQNRPEMKTICRR